MRWTASIGIALSAVLAAVAPMQAAHKSTKAHWPGVRANAADPSPGDRSPLRLIWLLLLVPYVGLLWVPFYNVRTPELWGFPFFYWYQLIWVPITAALTWLVYRSAGHDD